MKSRVAFLAFSVVVLTLHIERASAQSVSVQYLIVAGGGAGGAGVGGGGGGGGVITGTTTVANGRYPVTVGAGGVPQGWPAPGSNGGNSSFNGLAAIGGGGGGGWVSNGVTGGSGGGAGGGAGDQNYGGAGTSGHGYGGGNSVNKASAAGGGGAGGPGSDPNYYDRSPNGGPGRYSDLSGGGAYYGGGGGGFSSPEYPGIGGVGGGGTGAVPSVPGTPNTGGGGGGGASGFAAGAAGGSGIVIIRYPIGAITATGGAITTAGGYKIHTFTSSAEFVVSMAPTLTSIAPSSGNQGANVGVTLTGSNFVTGGTTVAVSGADVTVSAVNVTSSTSLTATFSVAWTAATGARNVTATTSTGTSNSVAFTVGAQPSPAGWLMKKDAGGNWVPSGAYEINGNIGVGTQAPAKKLHVAGDLQVDGNIAARYQDVAEWVDAADVFAPGTVVVVDRNANRVASTDAAYDTAVIGVVSAAPGVMLGEAGQGRILVAQSGRVRTKVDARFGAIHRGDLLVTSPNPGYAMRSAPIAIGGIAVHRPGTLIGKALEELKDGTGEILVLLTLQ